MLSSSLEKYLMTIYGMAIKEEELKCADISKALNAPLKKTIQALQRLHYQKFIVYLAYQPLTITEKGKEMARFLISRDALMEEFGEILQLPKGTEEEAEMMKQYLTYETLETIERFVAFNRQYPEVVNRYRLFCKRKLKNRLLERAPEEEI
ncbi:MAG: metal-dependent transcriptional regulator [Cellulosilyticaceae bacterium]